MNSNFDILVSFRTPAGFKLCAQFFLGNDAVFAETVFNGLSGSEDLNNHTVLHLDLVETQEGLPEKIRTIGCKLGELCSNCEHVTRELFRFNALSMDG